MYHMVHDMVYHMVQEKRKMKNRLSPRKKRDPSGDSDKARKSSGNNEKRQKLIELCLGAFVKAGTPELSLDVLADAVGISKRMLVHYFGHREAIEEQAMAMLEDRLRARFQPQAFPAGTPVTEVLKVLWEQGTGPESRGVLLLVMELTRRAWKGSKRAQEFYREQQRLWVDLLLKFSDDRPFIEMALQLFQGAMLTYVATGDRELGMRVLPRLAEAKS
jgi:AcrR family transcriptional regulator